MFVELKMADLSFENIYRSSFHVPERHFDLAMAGVEEAAYRLAVEMFWRLRDKRVEMKVIRHLSAPQTYHRPTDAFSEFKGNCLDLTGKENVKEVGQMIHRRVTIFRTLRNSVNQDHDHFHSTEGHVVKHQLLTSVQTHQRIKATDLGVGVSP